MSVETLKAIGFDRSALAGDSRYVRVGCSQCEALVISGVACHERGCPNQPSKYDDDYGDD